MKPTFEVQGDELPNSWPWGTRKKLIHSVGTVAKAEWRSVGNHPYTGIFKGATTGYARLSFAAEPNCTKDNTKPGLSVKFLRDGHDSANFVAMYSVDGQESWDFFANDFSNHIPAAGAALLPLAAKFATYTKYVQQVGLSDFASYGEDGSHDDPVFPFQLIFRPSGQIHFDASAPSDSKNGCTFTDNLEGIPAGSVLYHVFALDAPTELGGTETYIADLATSTNMTTTKWGDENMYFRH